MKFQEDLCGAERRKSGRVKRKLRENRGVTFVFALVVFLIATMVSCQIAESSLHTFLVVSASVGEDQAYLSTHSAALFLRESLRNQEFLYLSNSGRWERGLSGNPSSDQFAQFAHGLWIEALNADEPMELTWTVEGDEEIRKALGEIRLVVTAENKIEEFLYEAAATDNVRGPVFVAALEHLDKDRYPDYIITIRIAATGVTLSESPEAGAVYAVRFSDVDGKMNVRSQPGLPDNP